MSFPLVSDRAEALEPRPLSAPPDPLSEAVGSPQYSWHHRFPGLHIVHSPGLRSPRLFVSRFYWDVAPQVAVDFRPEVRWGADEVAAKRAFFDARGIRYVLCLDKFDVDAVLTPEQDDDAPAPPEVIQANRPVMAPRKHAKNQ